MVTRTFGSIEATDVVEGSRVGLQGVEGVVVDRHHEIRVERLGEELTAYAGLLQQFANQDRWYISRVYASGNAGWQALNVLSANYQDTRTLATNAAFVGDVLSQRLGLERSAADWEQSFRIGPRSASE